MSHNPAFKLLQEKHIPALNIDIQEFQHIDTQAQHIHIKADNNENVFMVAQRTVPMDSTGVAHILEHTALCGSKKYPVRDPFFMMIRRSLNTFMNAMTSSDWTAYPFASQNKKDFRNLLDVYLDAVFFSRLDPLDFAQEGHRLEFEKSDDSSTPLVYKGVVYNEMKGAMSSITSQLWQQLSKHLYPTTTYHYNSGGDPEDIPTLSYAELKDFYQKHYHPSNSIFMTFGDIPVKEHQDYFQESVLQHFSYSSDTISVNKEQRYTKPISVEERYAIAANDSLEKKTHHVIGWLLGESTSLTELLKAHLLSTILFDNSASPLMNTLETTSLGSAPSPLCGMDDSHLEMVFVCGIEGSEPEHSEAFETLVLNTLTHIAEHGVPQEQLDAALHQLELQQREIGGDGYPYGLQIMMSALTCATHRGNPVELIDLTPALNTLQKQAKEKDFVQKLVKNLLLDNSHRVRLTLKPDNTLNEVVAQQTQEKLSQIKSTLSEEEKQNIINTAKALEVRQNEQDDNSILPKVGLDDVADGVSQAQSSTHNNNITHYSQGTNGLTYQQILFNLPALSNDEIKLLPIYCNVITELGLGQGTYLESQMRQSSVTGGISASLHHHTNITNEQESQHKIVFSGKALNRHSGDLHQLLLETLKTVRFDESQRLQELFAQMLARRERSVTNNGHVLAMQTAISGMSPSANLAHQLSGLAGIEALKSLQKELSMEDLGKSLAAIHQKIIQQKPQYLIVSEEDYKASALDCINKAPLTAEENTEFLLAQPLRENRWEYWETNSQVSFCAMAFKTVPYKHPDSAALMVLGAFLRNGFLHRAIREQGGAYGAGASQDSQNAAFRFFSYRDPRIDGTIDDFKKSIEWLLKTDHQAEHLEEAILGVVGSMDKPGSPAGEAKNDFYFKMSGKTAKVRTALKKALLNVTLDDLKRVASEYLQDKTHSVAIVSNKEAIEQSTLSKQYSFTYKKLL